MVKVQHRGLVDETTRGLQFSLWFSPKPVVTVSAVSLASLCDLRPEEEDCETSSCSYIHCDLTITVGTEKPAGVMALLLHLWRKFPCLLARDHWTESTPFHRSQASSSGNSVLSLPWLCAQMRGQWIDGIIRNSRLGGHGWGQCCCRRDCSIVDSSQPAYQSVSCLFSVQENIWKICPVNSPLCSCLDLIFIFRSKATSGECQWGKD